MIAMSSPLRTTGMLAAESNYYYVIWRIEAGGSAEAWWLYDFLDIIKSNTDNEIQLAQKEESVSSPRPVVGQIWQKDRTRSEMNKNYYIKSVT